MKIYGSSSRSVNAKIHSDKGIMFFGDICYALDKDIYHNVWGSLK